MQSIPFNKIQTLQSQLQNSFFDTRDGDKHFAEKIENLKKLFNTLQIHVQDYGIDQKKDEKFLQDIAIVTNFLKDNQKDNLIDKKFFYTESKTIKFGAKSKGIEFYLLENKEITEKAIFLLKDLPNIIDAINMQMINETKNELNNKTEADAFKIYEARKDAVFQGTLEKLGIKSIENLLEKAPSKSKIEKALISTMKTELIQGSSKMSPTTNSGAETLDTKKMKKLIKVTIKNAEILRGYKAKNEKEIHAGFVNLSNELMQYKNGVIPRFSKDSKELFEAKLHFLQYQMLAIGREKQPEKHTSNQEVSSARLSTVDNLSESIQDLNHQIENKLKTLEKETLFEFLTRKAGQIFGLNKKNSGEPKFDDDILRPNNRPSHVDKFVKKEKKTDHKSKNGNNNWSR